MNAEAAQADHLQRIFGSNAQSELNLRIIGDEEADSIRGSHPVVVGVVWGGTTAVLASVFAFLRTALWSFTTWLMLQCLH